MACSCCSPDCLYCNSVTKESGPDSVESNVRQDPCRSNTYADVSLPCNRGAFNLFNPRFATCSTVTGVPSQYANCRCMVFDQQCSTQDYAVGQDANGACCVVNRITTYVYTFVFVFLASQCKWVKVYETSTITGNDCYEDQLATGGCSATCPESRPCSEFCTGPFAGCTCNGFP